MHVIVPFVGRKNGDLIDCLMPYNTVSQNMGFEYGQMPNSRIVHTVHAQCLEGTFARCAQHPNECSGHLSQCFTPKNPSLL